MSIELDAFPQDVERIAGVYYHGEGIDGRYSIISHPLGTVK